MRNQLQTLFLLFIGMTTYAQTVITGSVVDSNTKTPIPGVNITITNSRTGTNTDFDGKFRLETKQTPPFKLSASSVGFESVTLEVTSNNQKLSFALKEGTELDEVVVSASRTPERIFESPVTVEKLGITAIRNSTSASFYGGIESLKGVQINQGGIFMKQISTRGFSTVYNEGFVQLVDMMDNSAPGLNFPMGNLLGLNELDVKSVELMPGASSALYGANAIKGILFMNSISPFDKQGVSAYVKSGVTTQDAAGTNPFSDIGIRLAHKFSDKFAAKASMSITEGTDWVAPDNNWGERSADINDVFAAAIDSDPATAIYSDLVSQNPEYFGTKTEMTKTYKGYNERDLTDYSARSLKIDAALHYRLTEDSELSWNSKYGTGDAILQATNRNRLKDFVLQQHKLEYRNNHLTMRTYATIEDSGDTHDLSALGTFVGAGKWFNDYLLTYLGGVGLQKGWIEATDTPDIQQQKLIGVIIGHQANPATAGQSFADLIGPGADLITAGAAAAAQSVADGSMLSPDSAEFLNAKNAVISNPISKGGAAIQDNSKSYSVEGNYNFKDKIQWADVTVGGSYKIFSLDSDGTLFTDYEAPIEYNEYGVYGQAIKSIGKLKLTGSLRYDKSEFFDGNFTPRLGVLYNINENQNFRISYQTGFRNPSSQDQFIGLNVGTAILMGGSSDNVSRFNMNIQGENVTGQYVFDNALSLSSVLAGAPTSANLETVVPEQVESYEFGYRINQEKFNVDFNGYFSKYTNFLAGQNVLVPLQNGGTQVFQVDGNTDEIVNTFGANLGINTKLFGILKTGIVYEYNKMDYDAPANSDYEPGFNTPENRVKLNLGADNVIGKLNLGMNIRWNEEYYYESTFIDAMVPENTVIDFQANYPLSKASVLKIGASNLFGKDYVQIPGSGMIGQVSYLSWTFTP
ncbi:MAG: TonB-dependent receptor [Flavicella sp.]